MNRLVALFLVCAVLVAGCGVSRNDSEAGDTTNPGESDNVAADGGEQAPGSGQDEVEAGPTTTAPAAEVAATVEFGDGTSIELLHGETNEIAVSTRENQEFIDLLYQGQVPPGFDAVVLSQRVVQAVMDNELSTLEVEVTDANMSDSEELLDQQLQGILAVTSSDPPADAARLMDEVSYLPFIVQLQARQLALADQLSEGAEENTGDPCARHILVETEAEAQTVIDELAAGADFATLAGEKSIDPSAATNGGDLGCGPAANYVPEFADAVTNATLGEFVGPVQTDFGFHVLVVDRYEVNGDLLAEQLISEGLREATVVIDERVGTWDPQQLTIAPAGV